MRMDETGRALYSGLLEALAQVIGSARGYLADHSPRVALLAAGIADAMGMSREEVSGLFFAGVLADMGIVGWAGEAWEKPVPELPAETRSRVEELAPLIRHHHEWSDGGGGLDGLGGPDIPLGAQILRLADTVAGLSRHRAQRAALNPTETLDVVRAGVGKAFGPEVVDAYLDLIEAESVPTFEPSAFRHAVARASGHLLPEGVSPLSSDQLLAILANLIDAKDSYTAGHSRRVATLSVGVAAELGLPDHTKAALWSGGYLHDLGKLRVPLRILAKQEPLTPEEVAVVKSHPSEGAAILEGIPSLRHLTTGVRYHHERWDGRGYPEGLRGEHIPLVGQILAVCDSYDAMTSHRSYRRTRTHEEAVEEVKRGVGIQFSPRVAEAFVALPPQPFDEPWTSQEEQPASRTGGASSTPLRPSGHAGSDVEVGAVR